MPEPTVPMDLRDPFGALEHRLNTLAAELQARLDGLDRRIDQRLTELRSRQEEHLILLKAVSCQVRGRAERVERRAARG